MEQLLRWERLWWLGHCWHMDNERMVPTPVACCQTYMRGPFGRSRSSGAGNPRPALRCIMDFLRTLDGFPFGFHAMHVGE